MSASSRWCVVRSTVPPSRNSVVHQVRTHWATTSTVCIVPATPGCDTARVDEELLVAGYLSVPRAAREGWPSAWLPEPFISVSECLTGARQDPAPAARAAPRGPRLPVPSRSRSGPPRRAPRRRGG
ncbi:hypothetical protein CF166_17880 [Amycolatopsis sp. KNN50.9b]|nr:hypothetical protein CF166_17880 [Amycolatopsis sp. KNN50.9b]